MVDLNWHTVEVRRFHIVFLAPSTPQCYPIDDFLQITIHRDTAALLIVHLSQFHRPPLGAVPSGGIGFLGVLTVGASTGVE